MTRPSRRIEAEEKALGSATVVFTSTRQEVSADLSSMTPPPPVDDHGEHTLTQVSHSLEPHPHFMSQSGATLWCPHQVLEQWGLYDGYGEQLAAALKLRPCRGYHMPHMEVVPPGLDFSNLKVWPTMPWSATSDAYQ